MLRKDGLEKVYMLVTLTKLLILLFFHSSQNLRICLERFEAHINTLMNLIWINRTFHFFMFGDYKFLSSMYGISGAAGRHSCNLV